MTAYADDVASLFEFHGMIEAIANADDGALCIAGLEPRAAVLGFVLFAARHDPTVRFVHLDTDDWPKAKASP